MTSITTLVSGDRDGATYDRARDLSRLSGQALRVYNAMSDGKWRTLSLIAAVTRDPEASISARLRDLRKPEFGGFKIDKAYAGDGLWQYRLRVAE